MPTQAAVTGSRSGLTAIAPTIRIVLASITPYAAMTPATTMKTRNRATGRAFALACPSMSAQTKLRELRPGAIGMTLAARRGTIAFRARQPPIGLLVSVRRTDYQSISCPGINRPLWTGGCATSLRLGPSSSTM